MKKFLLSIMTVVVFATSSKINAQCEVSFGNVLVQIVSQSPIDATTCEVVVNVQFDLDYNAGAKYVLL
jgi:hypothetical protein